jgi:hypothetical protein
MYSNLGAITGPEADRSKKLKRANDIMKQVSRRRFGILGGVIPVITIAVVLVVGLKAS